MDNENCECGHPWADHYDASYCLEDNCGCGPCELCYAQFNESPINYGACDNCKDLKKALNELLGD